MTDGPMNSVDQAFARVLDAGDDIDIEQLVNGLDPETTKALANRCGFLLRWLFANPDLEAAIETRMTDLSFVLIARDYDR